MLAKSENTITDTCNWTVLNFFWCNTGAWRTQFLSFQHSFFLILKFLLPHSNFCFYDTLFFLPNLNRKMNIKFIHLVKTIGIYTFFCLLGREAVILQFALLLFPLLFSHLDTPQHSLRFCRKDTSKCQGCKHEIQVHWQLIKLICFTVNFIHLKDTV